MITALPTAPSRTQDQDTFDTNTDNFIAALPTFVTEANELASAMNLNSTTDTSATSNSIGTGAKTFTVSVNKSFVGGMWLVIADTAAPTNAMFAQVTSYSGTTLVVNSYAIIGSGTKTAWTISQSAPAALEGLYASAVPLSAARTGTEYSASPSPAITAYAEGQRFIVTFDLACPADPTLKLNGIATPPNLVRQNVDGTFSNLALNAFPAGWKSPVVAVSAAQYMLENLPNRKIVLTTTHDMAVATGAKSVTGAGFKAKNIRVYAGITNTAAFSIGEYVGVGGSFALYSNRTGVADANEVISNYLGVITESVGNFVTIALTSLDSDGVTMQITKTGTPTSTIEMRIVLEE